MSSINATSLIASVVLISLSALFSGLTLGLMGLDQVGLRIVIESGERPEASASDARYARRIQPFRKRGNLLLCTLLFGNVAVNCLLSIIMADMTSGFAGFLISTLSIVIFGEIIPQSVCSRHPLAIGSACIPLVYLFVILTFLASYPVSLILDQLLGEEIGTIYSRNQLKGMLEMYAKMQDTDFQQEDTNIMAGALDFGKKTVGTCMTKIEEVFMLHMDDNLNFETIMKVFQAGHSRVPVFEVDPHGIKKVVALLFVKELILVDPEDALPVRMLCHHWFGRDIPIVFNDCKTSEVMKVFKSGRSHMALVQASRSEFVEGRESDRMGRRLCVLMTETLTTRLLAS
ncbi:hypothetical protein GUITHDRAFT_65872 [Guillardia theta CCMP2712]|uniref:CNNM transmembrane domain-containing protein n=1 Tax=Guillardia theta (strain CCMP2712) TaxID=905079 RepID=L1JS54_GUITC|nr:hypothetical protein GUITHDRAFT_65872 [Guillardia theta CCMP2712]EKX51381.1 hypothetical protein GUITHDRAFT_65872 [Guillardia theta CCMP2712]|eukprot:XP_005838361.1 hypothetical protein GUITHDRAFT_65872 [Guillardia theta CCMP2712]